MNIPHGIIYNNDERLEELNTRINKRIIPDSDVKLIPNFDIRGAPTRNCLVFPILDLKQNMRQTQLCNYNIQKDFAPIQKNAPFINFASNVDTESHLRSQTYALQHGAEQSVYVPSSKSELYNVSVPKSSVNVEQPFSGLFVHTGKLNTTQNDFVNSSNIGHDTFHNHTQTQLRSANR